MKTNIILFAFTLLSVAGFSQSDTATLVKTKYITAMEKQVATLDTAFAPATLQKSYNALERIASAEKSEWLPDYYMAYCLTLQAVQVETSQIDALCDQANQLLDRADSLKGDPSEIFVMRATVASARIMVDPRTRGARYGKMSSVYLDSAEVHNPVNPRIYLTRGTGLYYTPPMFGGGKNKAKPVLEDAIKKYDAWVPKNTIDPHWGRKRTQMMLDQCNK